MSTNLGAHHSTCNQGAAIPKNKSVINSRAPSIVGSTVKLNSGSVKTFGAVIAGSTLGTVANRAKEIGIAGNRMKQLKELQRMQQSGSPNDLGRLGGTARGRQDCSHSANRAQCMRDNLSTGTNSNAWQSGSPNVQGLADCMNGGGNMRNCVAGNRGNGHDFSGTGTGTSGPRDPNDDVIIPGKGQAEGDGQWSTSEDGNTRTRSHRYSDGSYGYESETRNASNDNVRYHSVTKDSQGNIINEISEIRDRDGNVQRNTDSTSFYDDKGRVATFTHTNDRNGNPHDDGHLIIGPITTRPLNPSEQTAPDSASGGRPDNCNWNPALARCTAPVGDPEGQTTQPGPDGEYSGIGDTITAPSVDIGAVLNCGDTNIDACNRSGTTVPIAPYNPVDPEKPIADKAGPH